MDNLNKKLVLLRDTTAKERAVLEERKQNLMIATSELQILEKKVKDTNTKKMIVENATEAGRNFSKDILEQILSGGIKNVLKEDVDVYIDIKQRDGVPTADVYLKDVNGNLVHPSNGSGGVRDILSFASLVALNAINSDYTKAPLFLDEAFKNISNEYHVAVCEFIEDMKKVLSNKQMFCVTHDRNYMPNIADAMFSVDKNDVKRTK